MQNYINEIHIRGIVTSIKRSQLGNTTATRIAVVTNRDYTATDGTVIIESTFFSVSVFKTNTDLLDKGKTVDVRGRLRAVRYTDAEGRQHQDYEIVAENLALIDGEKEVEL